MKSVRWQGLLLRSERIRQNKGQKEICIGICVPSYLSKIERGWSEPTEEMLAELFERLGIRYETDWEYLSSQNKKMDEFFQKMLYGFEREQLVRELMKEESRLLYSPLRIQYLLMKGLAGDKSVLELLQEICYGMNKKQEAFYNIFVGNCAQSAKEQLECYQKANDILHHSYTMLLLAYAHIYNSEYTAVHNLESRLVTAALEEGNVYTIAEYYLANGTAYGSLDMDEMMISYYNRSLRMFENTGWKHALDNVCYNIGSVYLSQKRFLEAREYLERVGEESFGIWHKRALLAIRSKEVKEGKLCLEQMKKYLKDEKTELLQLLYEEACMEQERDFLQNPKYERLLDRLIVALKKYAHFGYLYFFKDVITQAYIGQRKYKKALEFQTEISYKIVNR